MLKKLYKHEFLSLLKSFAIIWCAVIALAVVNRITYSIGVAIGAGEYEGNDNLHIIYNIVKTSFLFVYIFGIVATMIASMAVIAVRFYRNFFGGEGYFTFTLPFTPMQHIVCKLLLALAMLAITFIVCGISLLIVGLGTPFFEGFFRVISDIINDDESLKHIGFFIEFLVYGIVMFVGSVLQLYCAISLGQGYKNKILASVIAYFVINLIFNTLFTGVNIASTLIAINVTTIKTGYVLNHISFTIYILLNAALVVGYFIITHRQIKYKLNLV